MSAWPWIVGPAPTHITSWVRIPGCILRDSFISQFEDPLTLIFISDFKQSNQDTALFFHSWLIIAITCHYVDESFNLQEDLLDFCEVSVSHTGANLAQHVFEVLIKYNIHNRLYCITTDNASNNGSLCEALSALLDEEGVQWDAMRNHIACLTHIINLAVKEFLKTLKIQERTPEDEWEVLEYKARIASSKRKSKYEIKGTNSFDHAIQKVRKISSFINFPPSHVTSFRRVCEAVDIEPR